MSTIAKEVLPRKDLEQRIEQVRILISTDIRAQSFDPSRYYSAKLNTFFGVLCGIFHSEEINTEACFAFIKHIQSTLLKGVIKYENLGGGVERTLRGVSWEQLNSIVEALANSKFRLCEVTDSHRMHTNLWTETRTTKASTTAEAPALIFTGNNTAQPNATVSTAATPTASTPSPSCGKTDPFAK